MTDCCESEPSFTSASDGLTYFNRCYMDVVTCCYHLSGPNTSPLPQDTMAKPTSTAAYSSPQQQVFYRNGTVSIHCDVIRHPQPDVTWEKQSEGKERIVMQPDQMYGNVVITNTGHLVVYIAQMWDTGIFTCIT
ncbi:hypothetical protein cypCar_00049911 [Cyprinus carpio]|nr:hypothetical protein cypCar_00049911 [Cyprinus carpio]